MNPQQMYVACTDALGAFVRGAGFTDVVIGLSGGMDSTLVAVMAADALGADHVHGVMLPGPYSSESSIDDAEALALALGISNITVPICEPVLEAVAARHPEVRFAKLNAAEHPDIAWAFKVVSVPTLVLFRDGVPVDDIVGAVPAQRIEDLLAKGGREGGGA